MDFNWWHTAFFLLGYIWNDVVRWGMRKYLERRHVFTCNVCNTTYKRN